MEYLECWKYVTQAGQINQAQRQRQYETNLNFLLNSDAPRHQTYPCTNAWGQLVTCIR